MSDLSRWCVSGPLKGHMAEALGRAGSEKTWEKRKRQESFFFLNDCNFGSLTKQRKNRTSRGSRNTHARVKNPDEKYGMKNTKWAEVCVLTVFCKVLSDHILLKARSSS